MNWLSLLTSAVVLSQIPQVHVGFHNASIHELHNILRTSQSPSAYVMYQFYTFPDHDTSIIPHSSDPHFSDDKMFPVSKDTQLDHYLKKQVQLTSSYIATWLCIDQYYMHIQ